MSENEPREPTFENKGGVAVLRLELLLATYLHWVERAAIPAQRATDLRIYQELSLQLDKEQL